MLFRSEVDSAKPDTGKFYRVFGVTDLVENRTGSVLLAICPYCDAHHAMNKVSDVEKLIVHDPPL